MPFDAFANFSVPSSKAGRNDYTVQARTIDGTPTGDPISGGLTGTFAWRGEVENDAATVDLVSESAGVIDTVPIYRSAVTTPLTSTGGSANVSPGLAN